MTVIDEAGPVQASKCGLHAEERRPCMTMQALLLPVILLLVMLALGPGEILQVHLQCAEE